ncbi:hypothetical protein FACS1894184_08080 [Clostridia bacterium]|nr:hypothetical protein FACS1894184_08080 [Clostridia bacterium]
MACNPKECLTGSPCAGCPMAERSRENPLRSEIGSRMMHWKSGEAESIEARWVKTSNRRKDAEVIAWYDRHQRVQILLHRVSASMNERACVNCPSRTLKPRQGENEYTEKAGG